MSTKTENKVNNSTEVPLPTLEKNEPAQVTHIVAGRNATHRLSGLGITIGSNIRIISHAPFHGPLQIEIRGTRLAIGRGLAQKILVTRV